MGFEPGQHCSHPESVNKFKDWMKEVLDEAKAALTKSKDDMARYYNQSCTPAPNYQPRDKVYLDMSDSNYPTIQKIVSLASGSF